MAIPALSTADKLFICSYNIGSNIDHRKALGNINEYTTFTSEYIDGFCWIPVRAPQETNDHSWWWDLADKDTVYVKVGVRVSADGYLHAWLTSSQKVSELILWNNAYNTTNQPVDDTTALHWTIEKLYRVIFGNTTGFTAANIKFQKYVAGATRLYLFGRYNNSWLNPVSYTIDHPTNVQASSVTWYPNNSAITIGDYIYSLLDSPTAKCDTGTIGATLYDASMTKAFLDDGGAFTDYTTEFNDNFTNDCPLMPVVEELGDVFYFGHQYRFYELKLNIGTAGVGSGNLIDWEFWNGSTWEQCFPTDPTNEFTTAGTNTIDFNMTGDDLADWSKTSVNGSSQYWVRARSTGTAYTTQPILTQGWVRIPDYWVNFGAKPFMKTPEPVFWKKINNVAGSTSIASICHPSDPPVPSIKTFVDCHVPSTSSVATGNNSGRTYNLVDPGVATNCATWAACSNKVSEKWLRLNQENNRAWVFVPAHCSDPAYDNQTDCENAGGTWYPDAYICDSSFTYDTSVSYTVSEWQSASASRIDYVQAEAEFPGSLVGDKFLSVFQEVDTSDTFIEIIGDLDELKHFNFTILDVGSVTNSYRTIFTKHVGIGLLTNAAPTLNTYDWIINWGANDYFSNWQVPDGLGSRTPGTPNTPYTRPITHHDEFSVVSGEPVLGGFLYSLLTSNAFLGRDPGTETKSIVPVSNLADFSFLYKLITSNAFLGRDPGTETKILHPICNDADFSFLYKFEEFILAKLYHLKIDGDDTKDGLSWTNAWKHWTYAAANTPNERTLLVEEGTYNDGETTIGPTNSIIIFLVKNGVDGVSTVTVVI